MNNRGFFGSGSPGSAASGILAKLSLR